MVFFLVFSGSGPSLTDQMVCKRHIHLCKTIFISYFHAELQLLFHQQDWIILKSMLKISTWKIAWWIVDLHFMIWPMRHPCSMILKWRWPWQEKKEKPHHLIYWPCLICTLKKPRYYSGTIHIPCSREQKYMLLFRKSDFLFLFFKVSNAAYFFSE